LSNQLREEIVVHTHLLQDDTVLRLVDS